MAGAETILNRSEVMVNMLISTPITVAGAPRKSAYLASRVLTMLWPKFMARLVKKMLKNTRFQMVVGANGS